jgi:hypothetical protein
MKIRSMFTIAGLMAAFVVVIWAAAIDGKWIASVQGREGKARETIFTLKAEGDNLTGTVTTPRGERPISDGKINGDEISFSVTMGGGENPVKQLYKGKVSGDEIQFTVQRQGAEGSRKLTAKRAS